MEQPQRPRGERGLHLQVSSAKPSGMADGVSPQREELNESLARRK